MHGPSLSPFASHLWLKDEIARALFEEELDEIANADHDAAPAQMPPLDPDDRADADTDTTPDPGTHSPSFLTESNTDVNIITGDADDE